MADIEASNWNETDSSNTAAAPDGAPEGMAPSGVNDVLRATMGATKRWLNRSNPKLTSGGSTAYTLSYGVAPGALVDGMTHLIEFHTGNGVGATLNVNLLGAVPLHYYAAGAWRVAPSGLIGSNQVLRVAYNATAGAYRILSFGDRTGELTPFAGSLAPAGSLFCYGQAISRTDYAGLFAAIGTAHGGGDGSTTFNVPDLRGRSPFGLDNMGGSNANRLSSVLASTTLGAAGGQQTESAGVSVSVSGSVSVGVTVSGTLTGSATGVIGGGGWDGRWPAQRRNDARLRHRIERNYRRNTVWRRLRKLQRWRIGRYRCRDECAAGVGPQLPYSHLIAMDPAKTVEQLGTGDAKIVLAVIVVTLAIVAWKLATALIESYKDRLGEQKLLLQQKSDDSRMVTDALKDMRSTMDMALATLKGRP